MSLNQLFDQFLGSNNAQAADAGNANQTSGSGLSGLASKIPGGLAGGAAAGGVVALLMGNKKARKYAGKAATYGGAALLGGLAFKAYQNWKHQPAAASGDSSTQGHTSFSNEQSFHQQALTGTNADRPFELTLIRAMIAAARADGHIDSDEQKRIFSAVDRMDLSAEHKGFIFDCLQQEIPVHELASEVHNIELKTEVYLASCLVIDIDHSAERAHLDALARALDLPADLCRELEAQAQQAYAEAA